MSSLQGRLFGSLREEERVLEDRRNYLSHGMGGSVDELLQFVAHCCGREVAACVVIVEGRLALRMPSFLEERPVELRDHSLKRFIVSRHRREEKSRKSWRKGGNGGRKAKRKEEKKRIRLSGKN